MVKKNNNDDKTENERRAVHAIHRVRVVIVCGELVCVCVFLWPRCVPRKNKYVRAPARRE